MEANTKAAIDKLISVMEDREQAIRESMLTEAKYIPNNPFMPGWAHGIHLSWEHYQADPEGDTAEQNKITCFYEFNGILVSERRFDEETDVDLLFLNSDVFENDIVPALRAWAQEKVNNEPFGGLFGNLFCVTITLHTSREVRESDPPHMQGTSWEQKFIHVTDETRTAQLNKMVYDFIASKEYLHANVKDIDDSLSAICTHAVKDYFSEFGKDTLLSFFEALLTNAKEAKYHSTLSSLMYAFACAATVLTSTEDGHEPSEDELALACRLCILILQNGTDKYEKDWGRTYLEKAADLGYQEAKNIKKFGTGQIPLDIVQFKDKLVTCTANDIDKVVDIKLKEESAEAYILAVQYLTRLLQNGFPGEYKIKCNSKVKNYIPTELRQTKTNNFFANAAMYPAAFEALREYAQEAFDDYNYYSDASDEESVTCGGYAAMALAFADPVANFGIAIDFMDLSDFEHAITSRYFVEDFAAVCKGNNKKEVEKYMKEFL